MEGPSPFERVCSATERVFYRRTPGLYQTLYAVYKAVSDRAERRLYRSLLTPGMIVVDVGANIGIYTDFFARLVGPAGAVYAFEPHPDNVARLSAVARRRNVHINASAVVDRSREIDLYVSSTLNVDHRVYDAGDGRARMRVPGVALDDYFEPGRRVDFVKMDVQGFEYQALRGMDRVLRENERIAIVLEYFPAGLAQAGASARELRDFLAARGFSLAGIRADGTMKPLGVAEPALNTLGYTNVVATRPS